MSCQDPYNVLEYNHCLRFSSFQSLRSIRRRCSKESARRHIDVLSFVRLISVRLQSTVHWLFCLIRELNAYWPCLIEYRWKYSLFEKGTVREGYRCISFDFQQYVFDVHVRQQWHFSFDHLIVCHREFYECFFDLLLEKDRRRYHYCFHSRLNWKLSFYEICQIYVSCFYW